MTETAPQEHVQLGQELTLPIYALAYGGEGIGRYHGMVVFIPDALPGDKALIRIVQVKQRFARGELLTLLDSSPNRIDAFCHLAGACGGCSWQHLAYAVQLQAKQTFVENALQHIGRVKFPTVALPIKSVPQLGYRHKIQIPFQNSGPQGIQAGFYAKKTHRIVPIEECPVQPALGNRLLRVACELVKTYGYQGYHEAQRTGQLRHLVIRVGLHTREILALLVTAVPELPKLSELAIELQERVPELVGVVQNINTEATNVILGSEFKCLSGRPYIYEVVRGLRYRISAESFFQVNPYQLSNLAEAVLQAAALNGEETIVDLFCGAGFLTLELARQARRAFGVESSSAAVEDALANKHLNHFSNVEFLAEDAIRGVEKLMSTGLTPDVLVLDPPRKGCASQLLDQLLAWKPQRMVYVSCNPITLARDLKRLVEGGYRIQYVQPIDLFPHTYHIESVVGLTHKR